MGKKKLKDQFIWIDRNKMFVPKCEQYFAVGFQATVEEEK
jgi:hypothetical protein